MENKKEEVIEKEDREIRESMIRQFAEVSVSYKANDYNSKALRYSASDIVGYLKEPLKYENAEKLQQVSNWMYINNGQYQRIIDNYGNMNTYDLYLFPLVSNMYKRKTNSRSKKTKEEKLMQDYFEVAEYIEKLNYKYNFGWIGRRLLIQNDIFLFKLDDSQGVIYVEIPSEYCKIAKVISNNLYKYAINMNAIRDENKRVTLPQHIQDLYEKHENKLFPKEAYMDGNNWLIIEDKNAIALSLSNTVLTKSPPKFSYIFPSIVRIMEDEIEEIEENRANNLKLIHMEVPIDEEGNYLIDPVDIRKYHESAKRNLPPNVAITTNPLKVQAVTLQRTSNSSSSNRETLMSLIYSNMGINSELFNGEHSSNQAILSSIKADEIFVKPLNQIFENLIKYEIKNKKKNSYWTAKMIGTTEYSSDTKLDKAISGGVVGLSRLKLLAADGNNPLEAITLLEFETQNGIDELFIPLATAYTQSANAQNGEEGRPKNSNNDNEKEVGDDPNSTK